MAQKWESDLGPFEKYSKYEVRLLKTYRLDSQKVMILFWQVRQKVIFWIRPQGHQKVWKLGVPVVIRWA